MAVNMAQTWPSPLEEMRTINFSVLDPRPSCTHLLQQMGSEVIKVEARAGDPLRNMNATVFSALNRGKKSVCVDAKTPTPRAYSI